MATRTNATILVVDDTPASRYSTSRVLRSEGFIVVEAFVVVGPLGGHLLVRVVDGSPVFSPATRRGSRVGRPIGRISMRAAGPLPTTTQTACEYESGHRSEPSPRT